MKLWSGRSAVMPGWRIGKAKVTTWEQLEESRITDCGHPELRLYCSRLQSYRSEKSKRKIISRSSILRKEPLLLNLYLTCVLSLDAILPFSFPFPSSSPYCFVTAHLPWICILCKMLGCPTLIIHLVSQLTAVCTCK